MKKLMSSTTAIAHPNIALIKYWGNRDETLRLPANGSISMNLDGLETRTQVTWLSEAEKDSLSLDGKPERGEALKRVSAFLDLVRKMKGFDLCAEVVSSSNFPTGSGIASSASAFAALALASTAAAGLELDEAALSRLARHGSGSACRSIPGGYVEWKAGSEDEDSFAVSIASPEHWDLTDCIAIVSREAKKTGSTEGHALAGTSPLQEARVKNNPRRMEMCREAILKRDFSELAAVVELDSNLMHAVMMTSTPPLFYWQPATLHIMQTVWETRHGGLPACSTVDAGPNVHVLTESRNAGKVADLLREIPGVLEVRSARPGGPAYLLK
jgi:diphosphomevalonate decarboxylase